MKKFQKVNIAFFIASCVLSMSINTVSANDFADDHGIDYTGNSSGSHKGDYNDHEKDENTNKKALFADLTLPKACLPVKGRMLKNAPINNETCHCPPISYCSTDRIITGTGEGNDFDEAEIVQDYFKLPEHIRELCCPPPPSPPSCPPEQYFDPESNRCQITPPPVCPPPITIPQHANMSSCSRGTYPVDDDTYEEGRGFKCVPIPPTPPGCSACWTPPPINLEPRPDPNKGQSFCEGYDFETNTCLTEEQQEQKNRLPKCSPNVAPNKMVTGPANCEVHYYDHIPLSGEQKTHIGTRAAEYCTRYVYTKNRSIHNVPRFVLPSPTDKTKDALEVLNECLSSDEVDGYRESIRDSLFHGNSNRLKYRNEENTWTREWAEMEAQLDLKDYIKARKDCFDKTGFSEKQFTTYGGVKSYQNLIPDNEKQFNEWAMLDLNDNVSDEKIVSSTGRKTKRGSWGIFIVQRSDQNDEMRALVNKYNGTYDLTRWWETWPETKREIYHDYNILNKDMHVKKFNSKIYGPLHHATVNQSKGIFKKFFDNTYDPLQVMRSTDNKTIYLEPETFTRPSYSYKVNDIDRILGEIPDWYNTKDGWRIIRGIKRAIAKTGADGYFYKNLTNLNADNKFKDLDKILPDHKKTPHLLSFDTPIYEFKDTAGDVWGVHCKDVKYIGICITTFAKDSSGETCLAPETKVTMSDGETKLIKDVKEGDIVESENGKDAVVDSVTELDWEKRNLYTINNGQLRLTADHPIMTKNGWRAINYHVRNDNNEQKRYGLKNVKPLEVGDVMITENGEVPVTRIMPEAPVKDGKTFNLKLKYNIKSFYANGVLVRTQN